MKAISVNRFKTRLGRHLRYMERTFKAKDLHSISSFMLGSKFKSTVQYLVACSWKTTTTYAMVLDWGQNPFHQFPRYKSVTSWCEQKTVLCVVSCRFPNSITTTCFQLAADLLAVSLTSPQQVRNKLATTGKLRRNVCSWILALSAVSGHTTVPGRNKFIIIIITIITEIRRSPSTF